MMLPDISTLGIIFAISLLIIIFSAIVLYLAFRIRETFRNEEKRGIRTAKIVFLIGTLFLAGGIFYFFARTLTPNPSPTSPPNGSERPNLALSLSYPPQVRLKARFTLSITITNPGEATAHDAVIQTNVILQLLEIVSSTHEVEGNVIRVGEVPPGTVVCTVELVAPERPGKISDTVTLTFLETSQPPREDLTISVIGGP